MEPSRFSKCCFLVTPSRARRGVWSRSLVTGDQGILVWWSIGAGVHVEPHSHANEQIVWMLKGKMEFRLGNEQRVCGPGAVVVIPGGTEHEGWFREDTEVIDFFAPPRDDFLLGGKPAYITEGWTARSAFSHASREPVHTMGQQLCIMCKLSAHM